MSEVPTIDVVSGRALPLAGDDIDTDRIIPARFLRTITFDGIEEHVFEDDRKATSHPFDDPSYSGASILLVNGNFGCGSSREHAPQALYRWGIRAVIGESFSDIFFGNAVMLGLPCVVADSKDIHTLMEQVEEQPGIVLSVSLRSCDVVFSVAGEHHVSVSLPSNARHAFITGAWDTISQLRQPVQEIETVAGGLPYVSGFTQ